MYLCTASRNARKNFDCSDISSSLTTHLPTSVSAHWSRPSRVNILAFTEASTAFFVFFVILNVRVIPVRSLSKQVSSQTRLVDRGEWERVRRRVSGKQFSSQTRLVDRGE